MLVRLLVLAWFYQYLIGSAEAGVRSDGIGSYYTDNRQNPRTIEKNRLESKDCKLFNSLGKETGTNTEFIMPWFEENIIINKEKRIDMRMNNNMRKDTLRNKIVRNMRIVKNMRKTTLRNKILKKARIMLYLRLQKRDMNQKKDRRDKRLNRKNSYFSK